MVKYRHFTAQDHLVSPPLGASYVPGQCLGTPSSAGLELTLDVLMWVAEYYFGNNIS